MINVNLQVCKMMSTTRVLHDTCQPKVVLHDTCQPKGVLHDTCQSPRVFCGNCQHISL